ncbi:response regulator [Bacteriovorax sp. DB6_IX]|uniref:ATP-binding response regulator n=1 Tax=Bacteriovorax sp. DB6_IX TaxID=1353530 RepID=UPI00038A30E0|nr:response regulator [Bacteriovorax sp. DB6_IX]EQC52528.1 response regulator receiver domain protein [Bacteriovorax sp. DB6_IX]
MRILVVDDDQINNKMLTKKLEKKGFDVVQAFCGNDCLTAVEEGGIDLVLLDIMMPDLSGDQVLVQLRKTYSAFELPIIMVTGKSETEAIVNSLRGGANDYIVKPVNIEVALARINTQLTMKKLNKDNLQKAELETAHAMIVTYNHEINNPLTIALGMLRKIEKDYQSPYIDKTRNALNRVVDIVKKIESVANSSEVQRSDYTESDKMIKLK